MKFHKNQSKHLFNAVTLAFVIFFSSTAFAALDATLNEANELIRQGQFGKAYALLEPLEDARAGEVNYDYLFGLAAVESGQATRGMFALERVLALEPNNKDARAELAKAHFMLGETDASKAEFNNVLQQNPDAQTKKTIEKLLSSIDRLEGNTTTFGAHLEFGLGWDSNVSSAPSIGSISLPAFGGINVILPDSSREQSDNFYSFAGGLSVRHPLSKNIALFGGVTGNNKINGSETAFDNSSLDFNLGAEYRGAAHSFNVALQDNQFDLSGEKFRRAKGVSAQWLYNINNTNQVGLYAQYSGLTFNGNSDRNADRQIIGANAGHVFDVAYKPVLFASIYGGVEDARKSNRQDLSQDILGMRLGGQVNFNNQWQTYANLGFEKRDADAKDLFFLKKRQDDQVDFTLGLRYLPVPSFTIRPQYSYNKVKSNVDIYEFDRQMISINVRKDFNW